MNFNFLARPGLEIQDVTGVWVQMASDQFNMPPMTVLCEKISENYLKCTFTFPWKEKFVQTFSVDGIFLSNCDYTDQVVEGVFSSDGEVIWRVEASYFTSWRRPCINDYLGDWQQVSTVSNEKEDISCTKISEEKFECTSSNSLREGTLVFTVHGTLIISDGDATVCGNLDGNGYISWFKESTHFMTWERKGSYFSRT